MNLLYSLRGAGWLLVYLVFILAPLFALLAGSHPPARNFWTEFSVALGYSGLAMMGLQFGFLLGGSIVVEKVFNWPGLGRLLVDAVDMRDYPVIQALVLLFSLEFILINLVVDVLYGLINPAIRYR